MQKSMKFFLALILSLTFCVGIAQAENQAAKKTTAIVYFSQTGNTRLACEVLAKELSADVFELKVVKPPSAKGELPLIEPAQVDLNSYSFVIVASPVWAANLVPAVRVFLKNNSLGNKKVAVLTTTNAAMPENFQEKHKKLVKDAGGNVAGYYQITVMDAQQNGKGVPRSKDDIQKDAMAIAVEIRKNIL